MTTGGPSAKETYGAFDAPKACMSSVGSSSSLSRGDLPAELSDAMEDAGDRKEGAGDTNSNAFSSFILTSGTKQKVKGKQSSGRMQ
mmetsp:Transcript_32444/g.75351  ORF Transcript_32444/g.75351 Transcript_32444/m.75351 type:complete len:86 (+) Transcript_32444:164-421(+)